MNIFRIYRDYRKYGINAHLQVFIVEFGFGIKYTMETLVPKLQSLGLNSGHWIVMTNGCLKEQGIKVTIEALKTCRCKVEVEDDGSSTTPLWLPGVDRIMVYWGQHREFNFGAMQSGRDMILGRGDISKFVEETKEYVVLKGFISNEPEKVKDIAFLNNIRVYKEVL